MIENVHSHISLGAIKPLFNSTPKTKETYSLYSFFGDSQIEFRNWIQYIEFYAHMQCVLIKVDPTSMANSLELRVPILNQRIVDFAWKLDSDFGLKKDKVLKGFLKKALGQHIPLSMMNQDKKGFYVPIGKMDEK